MDLSTGTIGVGPAHPPEEQVAKADPDAHKRGAGAEGPGKHNGRMVFEDCLGTCKFTARTTMAELGEAVGAATGWEGFTAEEGLAVGRRISHHLRVFNLRRGLTPELEHPSRRYGSTFVDGPMAGKSIALHWYDSRRRSTS